MIIPENGDGEATMNATVEKKWHLAEDSKEAEVTEFELQLWRVFNGFTRWVEECEKSANGSGLTAYELSILHIIRMKGRPKSGVDIGKLLNRSDNFNIGYTIKKLVKMGLVKKSKVSSKNSKSTQYEITEAGIKNTSVYRDVRLKLLVNKFYDEGISLSEMTRTISQLKTTYEEAEQAAAFYDHDASELDTKKPPKDKK